jgi:hypothetical protein
MGKALIVNHTDIPIPWGELAKGAKQPAGGVQGEDEGFEGH